MKKKQLWIIYRIAMLAACLILSACGNQAGLDREIDGSSVQAYQDTLSQLEQELSAADFRRFRGAVNYLQVTTLDYDTIDEFYLSLDGSTVSHIIAEADRLRQERNSSAE